MKTNKTETFEVSSVMPPVYKTVKKGETAELQMNGLDRFLLICSDKTMSEKSNLPLQVLLRPENRNKTSHKYMKSNQNEGS